MSQYTDEELNEIFEEFNIPPIKEVWECDIAGLQLKIDEMMEGESL